MLALLLAGFVANLGGGNALTLPAQRHLVQINGTYLMAVQQNGADGHGLSFYRSDDGGGSWSWYAPIQDNAGESDTADLVVQGQDVALVWSYEGPDWLGSSVWFQWWRSDGNGNWSPSPPVQVFGGSFQRGELAVDSTGALWVQAFTVDGSGGSTAVVAVSTDGGNSFSQQPALAWVGNRGGGRLISLGSSLMFLYGSHGYDPGRMMLRNDSDPPDQWSGPVDVFPEGLYHGAALSAVADGGGLHLAYKDLNEQLWYRYFDGANWSGPLLVEGNSDWALQPTTTVTGAGVVICFNHPISVNTNYQMWARTVSGGAISDPVVLDASGGFMGYPNAPERGAAACGYSSTPDTNSAGTLQLQFGG